MNDSLLLGSLHTRHVNIWIEVLDSATRALMNEMDESLRKSVNYTLMSDTHSATAAAVNWTIN